MALLEARKPFIAQEARPYFRLNANEAIVAG